MVCCWSCITIVTTPSLSCPSLPQDKQEVEPVFDLLKSTAAIGRAALYNLNLPAPLVHAAGDAVVLVTALENFIGGVYNKELPPTVALENIAEAGYMDTSFTSPSFGANRSGIASTCILFAQSRRSW